MIFYLLAFLLSATLLEFIASKIVKNRDPYYNLKVKENMFIPGSPAVNSCIEAIIRKDSMTVKKHKINFNNFGFRGEYQPIRPEGKRVALIGGSFVLSSEIEGSHTFAYLLEKKFKQIEKVDFLSSTIVSAKSSHYIAMLAHRVIHLHPTSVILFVGINDCTLGKEGYLNLKKTSRHSLFELFKMIIGESALYSYFWFLLDSFKERWVRRIATRPIVTIEKNYSFPFEKFEKSTKQAQQIDIERFLANILSFSGICNAHGVKLGIVWPGNAHQALKDVTVPKISLVDGKGVNIRKVSDEVAHSLQMFCKDHRIPLLNLTPSLQDVQCWIDDQHVSDYGSIVVAEEVEAFILSHELLK